MWNKIINSVITKHININYVNIRYCVRLWRRKVKTNQLQPRKVYVAPKSNYTHLKKKNE